MRIWVMAAALGVAAIASGAVWLVTSSTFQPFVEDRPYCSGMVNLPDGPSDIGLPSKTFPPRCRFGPITMRRVPALIQHQYFDRAADLPRDRIDLRARAVLIVLSLNQQNRDGDFCQVGFDIPGAELGMQPDIVPTIERGYRIIVVTA